MTVHEERAAQYPHGGVCEGAPANRRRFHGSSGPEDQQSHRQNHKHAKAKENQPDHPVFRWHPLSWSKCPATMLTLEFFAGS
jgi:hypothetical protein